METTLSDGSYYLSLAYGISGGLIALYAAYIAIKLSNTKKQLAQLNKGNENAK